MISNSHIINPNYFFLNASIAFGNSSQKTLTCSVGIGYSKIAAKTASEEKKPNGYYEILSPVAFVNLVIDRDVQELYTVGEKTASKLKENGIYTIRDIQNKKEKGDSL